MLGPGVLSLLLLRGRWIRLGDAGGGGRRSSPRTRRLDGGHQDQFPETKSEKRREVLTPRLEVVPLYSKHPKCVNLFEPIDDPEQVSRMSLRKHRQNISQCGRKQISELLLCEELKEGGPVWVGEGGGG